MQPITKDQTQVADITMRTGQEALDLVRQTAQLIKLAEDRGQALAEESQELAKRAVAELKVAEARIASLEEQLLRAEARVRESEQTLQRVYDELQQTLRKHPIPMPSIGRSRAA